LLWSQFGTGLETDGGLERFDNGSIEEDNVVAPAADCVPGLIDGNYRDVVGGFDLARSDRSEEHY
jgi:hypothetical protein